MSIRNEKVTVKEKNKKEGKGKKDENQI